MTLQMISLFFFSCGMLSAHDGSHGDSILSEENESKYADILTASGNRHLLEILLGSDLHGHSKVTPQEKEKLSWFRASIRDRSDLIVEILKRERVDVSHNISDSDWLTISKCTTILNFVRFNEIRNPEEIIEEVRLRMLPWKDLTFDHSSHHGYLTSLFEILIVYGDHSDLKRLALFTEHVDGIVRFGATNAFSRLEKKLREAPNLDNNSRISRSVDLKRSREGGDNNEKKIQDDDYLNQDTKNALWWIVGILSFGIVAFFAYKRRK